MYVAIRDMSAHGPDGTPTEYRIGDVLPHFMAWRHHIRRAMLSQNWVEYRPADVMLPVTDVLVSAARVPDAPPAAPSAPADEFLDDAPGVLACKDCNRTFKDSRGLNVHRAMAHKQIG